MQHLGPAVADILDQCRRRACGSPLRWQNMSRSVISRVTHASCMANAGSCRTIGSSHATILAHQRRHHGRGDRLRHRRQLEHGVIDRLVLARLPHAEALDATITDRRARRERQAGHAGLLQRLAHQIGQIRQTPSRSAPARHRGRSLRPRHPRQQQAEPG